MNKGIKILLYILATLFLGIPGPILVFIFIKSFEKKQAKKIKQELEAKERKEEIPRKKEWEEDEKQVYLLAEKIILDINTQKETYGYPLKIHIFNDKIDLSFRNNKSTTLYFSNYGLQNLRLYNSWWATDCTESKESVNQQFLLANTINSRVNNKYNVHQKLNESVSSIGSNEKMYHYFQEYVDMILK